MAAETVLEWTIEAGFALAALIILYRLATGGISLTGLLRTGGPDGPVEPERVQLVIGSIAAVTYYVGFVLTEAAASPHALKAIPEIPETAVALLTGGNILYLGGKIARTISKGGG